ncbi:MAG: beta-ketoacyl-[acyl-carrier-protein] synthase family protein [Bacteroidales bacterium]|nr:beta-ketoacyl-[acyl-carrier-protein] synthase family protein [Bacteroidales bacterium]
MNHTTDRIVITGMGAVTPIGCNVEEYWKNLIACKSGIGLISRFPTDDYPVKVAAEVTGFQKDALPKRVSRDNALFAQFAYAAAEEAIAQSGIDCEAEANRIGITMGTAMSGVAEIAATQAEMTATGTSKISPKFVPKTLGNIAAAQIAIEKHLGGPCMTVSTACSSGADAIKMAQMLLAGGEADAIIAVGGESILCPVVTSSLSMAKALSTTEDPTKACIPFDIERNGFVMGEGGGALVLETESHAVARGAKILGVVVAASNNTDGYHITSPAPDGHGAIGCMRDALRKANLQPSDIGYINAHGTSTPMGDTIEAAAIREVFGTGDSSPLVSSTKGATGHLMGAGGITETIACLMACRTGIIPATIGTSAIDPACEGVRIVTGGPARANIRYAMSNAFGFGGQNSSVIVSNYTL